MNTLFLAFILLCLSMYVCRQLVDVIFHRFDLFPKENKVFEPQAEAVNELLQSMPLDYSFSNHSVTAISNCELESVSSKAVEAVESLSEGVQAIAEMAGEYIATTF
jgi:hypothetical protein